MAKKPKKRKKAKKKTKAAARNGDVIIITGASGVKPKKVLNKFNEYLIRNKQKAVKVYDLEELLVKHALKDPICKASPTFQLELQHNQRQPIIAVTSLPYPLLKTLWNRAVQEASKGIKKTTSSGQNVAFVMHAAYFKPDSTEFVPIADVKKLLGIKPKCVVHLIDDIYDVLDWLRGPDGIFNHIDLPEDNFEQLQRCIRDLMSTLIWRQAEAGASIHLASLLNNIPLFTLATKHRCRLLQKLFETNVHPVYLSHPISEARKKAVAGDKKLFEDWAAEVGNLADHLSTKLDVWEPTTIDELRLKLVQIVAPTEKGKLEETKMYIPRLLQRWPLGNADEILWSQPPQQTEEPLDPAFFLTNDEVKKIENAETWDQIVKLLGQDKCTKLRFISGQLAHLVSLISIQINSRDRTLVGQCPAIIIYRPVFNGNKATGVVKELQAHRKLVELQHYIGQSQGVVFVLENSDDEKLVWRNAVKELLIAPKGRWSGFAKEERGQDISSDRAGEIACFVTKNNLSFENVVKEMKNASQVLEFHWGEIPQSTLVGAVKGQDWAEFDEDRVQELKIEIKARMHYKKVLGTYEESQKFVKRDLNVIDFANIIIKVLTNQGE